jgi:hypothetical protein
MSPHYRTLRANRRYPARWLLVPATICGMTLAAAVLAQVYSLGAPSTQQIVDSAEPAPAPAVPLGA